MKYLLILTLVVTLVNCNSSSNSTTEENAETYSDKDSIDGPIHTAVEVKEYTQAKNYDALIGLFTKEKQAKIKDIKANENQFKMWVAAWTLDDVLLEKYIEMIKMGKAKFKYEDGSWKIDEL